MIAIPMHLQDIGEVINYLNQNIRDIYREIDQAKSLVGLQKLHGNLDANGYRIKNVGQNFENLDAITKDSTKGLYAPSLHSSQHQNGGFDEVNVVGLSGQLADLQLPIDHAHNAAGGGVGGLVDHGVLTGKGDDDHVQYVKEDGTRVYTGTGNGFKDEDNMASDSAVATASQQSIKKYVDDKTGAGTDSDAIHDNVAGEISAITEKVSPVNADLVIIEDSADSNNKKKVQVGNLPSGAGGDTATLKATLTNKVGVATVAGYVYRLDPDNDSSFDYASEDEDAQVVVAAGVIADNASGSVVINGYTDVYVDGIIDVDISEQTKFLYFSSTDGQAKVSGSREDGCFGEAVADSSGAGLVKAIVYNRERIRKWAWSGEMSKTKSVFIPLCLTAARGGATKYASNPILSGGSGWEAQGVRLGSIVKNELSGLWHMTYNGVSSGGTHYIGVATAPEIRGPWTKDLFNPAISDYDMYMSDVIYDEYETDSSKKFKLITTVRSGSAIRLYYSADGFTWTAYGSNPLSQVNLNNLSWVCGLIRLGRRYIMAYTDSTTWGTRLAESDDCISWYDLGHKLSLGAGGQFDDVLAAYTKPFFNQGILYLAYSGYDGSVWRVGLAYSNDLMGSFNKYEDNPIVDPGTAGVTYDGKGWQSAQIIQHNKEFYMLCSTMKTNVSSGPHTISLLTIP